MKIIANKESYGFKGGLYQKGDIVEVSEGENYPKEHFDIIKEAGSELKKPEPEIKLPEEVKPKTKKKH